MATNRTTLLETRLFRVEQVDQAGTDGQMHRRQIVRHPGAVAIVPLVDDQHVCLIRNRRVAVGQTLIELPAGTLEPNERPEQTAARELIEETGYEAEHIEPLREFFLSPGILDERMHLFAARGLRQVGAAREPGEHIENFVVTWRQAIDMIDQGQIQDAKTLVGLLYFDRFRRG